MTHQIDALRLFLEVFLMLVTHLQHALNEIRVELMLLLVSIAKDRDIAHKTFLGVLPRLPMLLGGV